MGRQISIVAAMAACALHSPALADPADEKVTTLTPSSPWHVDFGEEKCRLARTFGEGENRHLLYFDAPSPTSNPWMIVAGPRIEQHFDKRSLAIEFGTDWVIENEQIYRGNMPGFGSSVQFPALNTNSGDADHGFESSQETTKRRSIPRIDLDRAQAINRLKLSQGGFGLVLETGSIAEAFRVLNDCSRSLIEHWGLDVAQHEDYLAEAKPLNWNRVQRDFFDKVLKQLGRGRLAAMYAVTLIVEANGRVSNCFTYKITALDADFEPACEIAKRRARFDPALDRTGKPMRSYFSVYLAHRSI